jgi:hypothetical protein
MRVIFDVCLLCFVLLEETQHYVDGSSIRAQPDGRIARDNSTNSNREYKISKIVFQNFVHA